jgi:hypothetical protein
VSAIKVAGFAALTVGGFLGAGLVALATSKWEFLDTGSPEQLARAKSENLKAALLLGGIFGAAALVTAFTPYTNAGKGVMFGTGFIGATIAVDKAFPRLLAPAPEPPKPVVFR